jgi:hypothetical protein
MRKLFTALLVVVLFGGFTPSAHPADPSADPSPDVAVRSVSGAGKLTATGSPRGLRIDVVGSYNDGGATLAFGRACPSRLTFRFANLRGWHSFTVGDGKRTFGGDLVWAGGKTEVHFDRAGRRVNNATLAVVSTAMRTVGGNVETTVLTRGVERSKSLRVGRVQIGPALSRNGFPNS